MKRADDFGRTANMTRAGGGRLFDIHRFSLDDGPGIRTSVFFKGCNMACAWCHNPESIRYAPQISKTASLCIGCGACRDVCPKAAIAGRAADFAIDRGRCGACAAEGGSAENSAPTGCGAEAGVGPGSAAAFAAVCPRGALKRVGYDIEARDLIEIIKKDVDFYDESGGGVTFTGGEPTVQSDFLLEILEMCKESGIRSTLDTNGNCDESLLELLTPLVDYAQIDIKHVDDAKHEAFTGAGCAAPMRAARFFASKIETEARVPVIAGFNYSAAELSSIIDFLDSASVRRATFLPYHSYGAGKYKSLGLQYRLADLAPLDPLELQSAIDRLDCRGVTVTVAEK